MYSVSNASEDLASTEPKTEGLDVAVMLSVLQKYRDLIIDMYTLYLIYDMIPDTGTLYLIL